MQDSISSNIDLWAREVLTSTPAAALGAPISSVEASQLFGDNSQFVATRVEIDVLSFRNIFDTPTSIEENILSLVMILSVGYIFYRYHSVILQLISTLFKSKSILPKSENLPVEYLSYIKFSRFFSLLAPSAVLALIFSKLDILDLTVLGLFGAILCGFLVVFYLKSLLIFLLSKFDCQPERWSLFSLLRSKTLALLALLFSLLVTIFSLFTINNLLLLILGILLLGYYSLKIILIFIALRFSFFQSILYLCAFEIAPYLVLWGLISTIVVL